MLQRITRYIKNAFGVDVNLVDHPQPAVMIDNKTKQIKRDSNGYYYMQLPVEYKTMSAFLSAKDGEIDFSQNEELYWSVLIAAAAHESAHLLSGEPYKIDDRLYAYVSNVVNDANDQAYIPQKWPGLYTFVINLERIMAVLHHEDVLKENDYYQELIDENSVESLGKVLMSLLLTINYYRQHAYVTYQGKEQYTIPEDHIFYDVLSPCFEAIMKVKQTKYQVNGDNTMFMYNRSEAIETIYKNLHRFYAELQEQAEQEGDGQGGSGEGQPGDGEGSGSGDKFQEVIEITIDENGKLNDAQGGADGNDAGNEDGSSGKQSAQDRIDEIQKDKKLQRKVKVIIRDMRRGDVPRSPSNEKGEAVESNVDIMHINNYERLRKEIQVQAGSRVNDNINSTESRKLYYYLKSLLFARNLSKRVPTVTGNGFAPENFYKIRTDSNPRNWNIRKDKIKIRETEENTALALCFDRSGSMSGSKIKAARHLYYQLFGACHHLSRVKIGLYSFDDGFYVISDFDDKARDNEIKSRIENGLYASGGTNFPQAMHYTLNKISRVRAKNKVVLALTDGDIDFYGYENGGDFRSMRNFCDQHNIKIVLYCIDRHINKGYIPHFDDYVYIDNPGNIVSSLIQKAKQTI